jgi:dihydrofolate reductase
MGKVVVFMSVSLDGFIEGQGQRIDWHRVDDELHRHFNEQLRDMGGFLHGRVTYDLMAAFWPTADADPANAGAVAEFAGIWRDKPKIVYSRTLEHAGWNTKIAHDVAPGEVRALTAEVGDVSVGGADLVSAFRELDLIDEYRVYVHPVLVGRGKRLFADADAETDLELLESRAFGNGVVLLRYARAGASLPRPPARDVGEESDRQLRNSSAA